MFKIVQNPTYTWPVTLELPADGGKTEKATFDAEFKRTARKPSKKTIAKQANVIDGVKAANGAHAPA